MASARLHQRNPLPKPYKSHKALNRNTHTMWDNPGCLACQPSTGVSGITLVDWLDKDS